MLENLDWLRSGGAEIFIEVARREGWTVEVVPDDDWVYLPEIIAVAFRSDHYVCVREGADACANVIAVALARTTLGSMFGTTYIKDLDAIGQFYVSQANELIGHVRLISEVTAALIGKEAAV